LAAVVAAPRPHHPGRGGAGASSDAGRGTGDLVLAAAPGYDVGADYERVVGNYRGGHGGLRSEQITAYAMAFTTN
jgi:hypothetical protein